MLKLYGILLSQYQIVSESILEIQILSFRLVDVTMKNSWAEMVTNIDPDDSWRLSKSTEKLGRKINKKYGKNGQKIWCSWYICDEFDEARRQNHKFTLSL